MVTLRSYGLKRAAIRGGIDLIIYVDESQLDNVMRLVGQDLSEPYLSNMCFLFYNHMY